MQTNDTSNTVNDRRTVLHDILRFMGYQQVADLPGNGR